ncbi:MAG: VapE family protein [Pseudorhodobacter sp.]|nr:VapE family protein [Pseudorhodobacter sp.]
MSLHNSISSNEKMQAALATGSRSVIQGASGNLSDLLADGPLDIQIPVTIFPNVLAASLDTKQLTLRQLARVICTQEGASKSDLPLLKLATFGDVRTVKGSLRHDANLQSVSGIEGDYDAGEIGPEEAADRLSVAGIAALIYTTPSHTSAAPRWRVLVPLAMAVTLLEREEHCACLNGALGGILAAESFIPSQSYFFGNVLGRPVKSILVDGQPLDRVTGIASIGSRLKQVKLATDLSDLLRDSVDPAHVRRALEAITDADDRDQWLKIGMALHSEFGGSDTAFDLWSNWSKQSEKFDAKDQSKKWRSFRRNGIGIGTLYQIASAYGWRPVEVTQDDFDDLPELPAKEDRIGLIRFKSGDLKPTLHNAVIVLQRVNRDQAFSIRRNLMRGQDEWRGGAIDDADLGLIRVAIEQAGMHSVGADLTTGAVRAVAQKEGHHPVRNWLDSLRHDGTARLDTWLTRYLRAEASPYTAAVGRAFLIAMVARVMRPGCKHDHVLVLSGPQGVGKSTACRVLGGEWFGDNMPSIREGAKEAGLFLRGHWLVELAEMAPSRKSDAEDLKAFLSRDADEIRAPYARRADVVPRQCVFVGTTNDNQFLRDMTGGRRFWPIFCGETIDLDGLAQDREQLFTEAVAAFRSGAVWHLTPEIEGLARHEQEAAREEDPWEGAIREILDSDDEFHTPLQEVTARQLLSGMGMATERQTQSNMQRAARILKLMGWIKGRDRKGPMWRRK